MARSKKAEAAYEAAGKRPGKALLVRMPDDLVAKMDAQLKPGETRQAFILGILKACLR